MRALSIAGAYPLLIAKRIKIAEVRKWEEKTYRGWVLLHCSSSKEYDFSYKDWNISFEECPKGAIVGAAKLTHCKEYENKIQWHDDIIQHKWNSPYHKVVRFYEQNPFGHFFETPILFKQPILNVKGTFRYWLPKTEEQIEAFAQAAKLLELST